MATANRIINTTGLSVQFANKEKGFDDAQLLPPGDAYSIVNSDPEAYIARDAHSGVALTIRKTAIPENCLLITEENLLSQPGGNPIQLEIRNTSKLAIEVCSLNNTSAEAKANGISMAKLPPNALLKLDSQPHTLYGVRLYTSGTYFQTFVTSEAPVQSLEVNPTSSSSDVSSTLTVENKSTLSLVLQWIDFDGTLRHTKPLDPGYKLEKKTFLSHPWILRDTVSGLAVDICLGGHQPKNRVFTGQDLRSIAATKPTTVEFWNAANFPVKLFWKDYDGKSELVDTLLPGSRRVQPTRAGHVWEMQDARSNQPIQQFLPSPNKQQICRIIPRNADLRLPPEITFDNDTGLEVELVAKDLTGVERIFATLPHRAIHKQPTTTADRWYIKDRNSGRVLEELVTSQENFTHVIIAKGIQSELMKTEVEATFVNTTPFTVDVSWIDYDGVEEHYHRLKPGQSLVQPTHATHVWRFRERETRDVLHLFVANEKPKQKAEVVMKPLHSLEPAVIRFRNFTGLTTEVVWFDAEGKPKVLRTLIPGRKAAFKTFATHAWVLRDKRSQTVLRTIISQPGNQTVTLNHSDIRSKRSDRGTQLIFYNRMPFKVDIHWIDYDGKEMPHETLRPGGRLVKSSYTTQPYRFRHHITKKEVGVFLPKDVARQAYYIGLRAYEDKTPTSVEVRNMTALKVKVFKVDHNRKEKELFELEPRHGATVQTYSTHPIMVRDAVSNEAIAFTIAGDKPQLLEVTGEHLRSNLTEFPVWITWENTLKLPVDLYWVKYDGSEELMKSLAPGESYKISSYPTHVWRARFPKAGTEVDLYITGKEDQQTRNIGALPPLRTTEREGGVLWDGEVALYEKPNFEGRVWIAHGDLPDFAILSGFNDSISSLKVGRNTAVTVFEDSYFNRLPQDMSIMAKEVKEAVEKAFRDPLTKFKEEIDKVLNDLKKDKEQAFIDQINLIQGIFKKAVEQTPGQVGLIVGKYVEGTKPATGEQLVSIDVDQGKVDLENLFREILHLRVSTEDRIEFAKAILDVLQQLQDALFEALEKEWNATLDEQVRELARKPLDILSDFMTGSANMAARLAAPLVQKPDSDVFHVEAPDLEGTDIGRNKMSSLRVLKNFAPEKLRISSTNKVVDDPKMELIRNEDGELVEPIKNENGEFVQPKKLVNNPVYRTTIKFPPEVTEVQIWGTELQKIEVSGEQYEVGPKDDQFARVQPRAGGTMILQVKPDKIGIPPLMIRTNSMPSNGRVFIFPDADVHRKFAKMEDDAFVNGIPDKNAPGGRRKLEVKPGVSNEDISGAQQAIQTLSRTSTASARNNATGTAADRRLVTGMMDMSAFQLDFGGETGTSDAAFRPIDPAKVHAQAVDAEDLSQGFFDFIEDVGEGIASVAVATVDLVGEGIDHLEQAAKDTAQFFEDAANTIADGFEDFGEMLEEGFAAIGDAFEAAGAWIEEGLKDGLEFMGNAIEAAGEFLEDVGTAIVDAAKVIGDGIAKGLQVVVEVAGKVVTIIVDTIEKVGEVVMYVAKKVVEVVEKVVDFICALFNWGDILKTQSFIMDAIDRGLDKGLKMEEKARKFVNEKIDFLREEAHKLINDWREALGLEPETEEPESDDSDAMDAIMWLFEKITEGLGKIPSPGLPEPDLMPGFIAPAGVTEELNLLVKELGVTLKNTLGNAIDNTLDTILDFINQLKDGIKNPQEILQVLGGLFLNILELIVDITLDLIQGLANIILRLIRVAIKLVKAVINFAWDIPVLKELFDLITGETLTIKSLVALLLAMPATIIGKLIMGSDRFMEGLKKASHTSLALDMSVSEIVLKSLYATCHLVFTVTGAVQDGFRIAALKDKKQPHTYYTSLKWLKKDAVMTLINFCISIAAIATSGPYFQSNDPKYGKSHTVLSGLSWGTQWLFLVPSGVGLALAKQQKDKGHKKLSYYDNLGSFLTFITGAGGIFHLMINGLLTAVESKISHFKTEEGETSIKTALGIAYISTAVPPIFEWAFFFKNPWVLGGAAFVRGAGHAVEGGAMIAALIIDAIHRSPNGQSITDEEP